MTLGEGEHEQNMVENYFLLITSIQLRMYVPKAKHNKHFIILGTLVLRNKKKEETSLKKKKY